MNQTILSLWEQLTPVFDDILATAPARDAATDIDTAAVQQLVNAGFTRLRIPKQFGGYGLSLPEAYEFFIALATADSNLAQALRAHWSFVEDVLSRTDDQHDFTDRWLSRLGAGAVVGNAITERGNQQGENITRLERRGGQWVLNGTKYYSTGTGYADWIAVAASGEIEEPVSLMVAAEAPGVEIVDDWDGFGQRLTASGTTRFTDVIVDDDDVFPVGYGLDSGERTAYGQASWQTVHLATLVGIAQAVIRDGAHYVQSRTRTFSHGAAETVRQDPQVLQLLGELEAKTAGIATIFHAIPPVLAEHYAADARGELLPEAEIDALYARVYQAQQVIAPITLEIATKIFEVGGASATSQTRALDRHWRNARVLASHNPLIYRARILGDFLVNGRSPDRKYTVGQAVTSSSSVPASAL
ncbi:acyl-CoA dehydrogenase family protein [Yaniella halotolerans]|uniref:acyl-CoA dehydrogenase family protein n=1 Tax=Yaniella halotolerans TaxID=225453 RepID=UPI0003B66B04|nr:acyl-CoA dehydrogenase family protein [Yaniella halotolerans]